MGFGTVNETVEHESFWDFKGKEKFVDEWFLMSSPVPLLLITVSYLLFVLRLGPEYMKKIPPLNLSNLLLLYNGTQVLVSCYLFCYGVRMLWPQGLLHTRCILDKETTRKIATGIYIYFFAKISELLDTVFFVLRKKNNQITFLHVYHHTVMMIITWFTLKYEPTYTTAFLGTVNCFVHIIMYTYYGLSAIPRVAKYLWWKKYITSMQLVQFLAVFLQATINYAYSGCPPSYTLLYTILLNTSIFLYLFSDFYIKAYFKNQREKAYKNANSLNEKTSIENIDNAVTSNYTGILVGKNKTVLNGIRKRPISRKG